MSRKPVLHNDDLQLESGFRTDLLLPYSHYSVSITKNIFPVKSNVRKGHIHQSMLINPLPFPLQGSEQFEKKEKKMCTKRVNKPWRHLKLVQERINISANTQVTRYKLIIQKSQVTVIILRLTHLQRVYIDIHFSCSQAQWFYKYQTIIAPTYWSPTMC